MMCFGRLLKKQYKQWNKRPKLWFEEKIGISPFSALHSTTSEIHVLLSTYKYLLVYIAYVDLAPPFFYISPIFLKGEL